MIEREQLMGLLKGAIGDSKADGTELVALQYRTSLTRYADSTIHQNVEEDNNLIVARAALGKRLGVSSTNRLEAASLGRVIERAAAIAERSPESHDFPGFPGAERAPEAETYSGATAGMTPDARADAVSAVVDVAKKDGLRASGAYKINTYARAVANSAGTEQYYIGTDAALSTFIIADDGTSSSAIGAARDIGDIDPAGLAKRASERCKAANDPIGIEPGEIDVVLEPRCTAELLEWLCFTSFGAKQLQEGQSFMTGRIGKKLMGENVSFYDDGFDDSGMPIPFDYEGVPKERVALVEGGVVKGPVYDALTAAKDSTRSTGHAGLPIYRGGPSPSNLFMAPGESTAEEMIASVKRGLLVTQFHYVNGLLDTRKALFTGMTRDGTFLIEDGRITRAVKNLRFTESLLRAFSNVDAISKERQIITPSWGLSGSVTVPTVLIRGFRFTGATEF